MTEKPEALRLADSLDAEIQRTVQLDMMHHNAAAELRRLHAENEALRKPKESAACSNTFGCQCSKHFASQQLEQRPKRALTAVWRDRAQRSEAQRDTLLEALQALYDEQQGPPLIRRQAAWEAAMEKARAAIKAVEGEKT